MAAVWTHDSAGCVVSKFIIVLQRINSVCSINAENREKLHLYLDELSSFNHKKSFVLDGEIMCKTFLHLTQLVPETDSTLCAKICQLLSRLQRSQSLCLPAPDAMNTVLKWCLRVLASAGELALLDVFSAVEMLLRGRAVLADPQVLSSLLADTGGSSVVPWLSQTRLSTLVVLAPAEVELAALRVLKAIASPAEPGSGASGASISAARVRRLETCATLLIEQLSAWEPNCDIHFYKKTTVCLKGIQAVVLQRHSLVPLAQGLGIVRAFWLLGLPEHDPTSFPPTPAEPGPPPPSAPAAKSGARKNTPGRVGGTKHAKRMRSALVKGGEEDASGGAVEVPRSKRGPGEDEDVGATWLAALSDSEDPSDTESGSSREKQAAHSTVRFASLRLLLLLIKHGDHHALMSFWDMLMPYSPPGSPPSPQPSLPCCLLRDFYVCSRTAAAQCIAELLQRCQLFLALAEASSVGSVAFTPWSHRLAQALDSCQRCLTLALSAERVSQCLVTTLGALAALALATPYHRLPPGPLSRLARCVRPQLFHASQEVRAAALAVFGALASSSAASNHLAELKQLLNRPPPATLLASISNPAASSQEEGKEQATCFVDDDGEEILEDFVDETSDGGNTMGRTWLVEYCLDALELPERSKRFRLEPCRVLAALSRTNMWLFLGEGVLVRTSVVLAKVVQEEQDQNIQLTAGRALTDLGEGLSTHLQLPAGLGCLGAALEMWGNLLGSVMPQLAVNTAHPVRRLCCDLLVCMGAVVYDHLLREQRLLLSFQLFELSRDPVISVCTSAVRALGVCVSWPAFVEEGQFVLDTAEYVAGALTSNDDWLKNRAAWALSNLGEALVSCNEQGITETLPEHLLMKMIERALVACQGQDDKLKAYSVRALGNLLRLLSPAQLRQPDTRDLVSRVVTALVECASSTKPTLMKVRWNACHSLACLMKGQAFCEEMNMWQAMIFPMLCDLVVSSPNFKVRISAAVALAAPSSRSHYTAHFLPAWAALLEALDSADNVHDFKEFQHRDNLVDQICLSVSHLSLCLEAEDLAGGPSGALTQLVLAYEHQLHTQLQRVRQRLVPERAEPLGKAAEHLTDLSNSALVPAVREAAGAMATILGAEDFSTDLRETVPA